MYRRREEGNEKKEGREGKEGKYFLTKQKETKESLLWEYFTIFCNVVKS